MDKYNNDNNINISNDNNNITIDNTIDKDINIVNDKKSFSQRLGEANVMPNGMLSAIDDTDRVILAIEKGAHKAQLE